MVQSYLKAPVALRPFSTVEVFIAATDVRGGTGANFVVDWGYTGEIAEPAVEALMVGSVGPGHYAFISQGASDQADRQELARLANRTTTRRKAGATGLLNKKQRE